MPTEHPPPNVIKQARHAERKLFRNNIYHFHFISQIKTQVPCPIFYVSKSQRQRLTCHLSRNRIILAYKKLWCEYVSMAVCSFLTRCVLHTISKRKTLDCDMQFISHVNTNTTSSKISFRSLITICRSIRIHRRRCVFVRK